MTSVSPITVAALRYLGSDQGEQLLASAAECFDSLKAQKTLRTTYPAEFCRAAFAVAEQRRRATADKFPILGDSLFMDRDVFEMASREDVAAHRATRFARCEHIADLCCGAGADAIALASVAPVIAIEFDPARAYMALLNARAACVTNRLTVARGNALHPPCRSFDALFADPSRRALGKRRRTIDSYEPSLEAMIALCRTVPRAAIKVAPGISYEDLPADAEVEFVSSAGQCREAVLYFGKFLSAKRRATVLPNAATITSVDGCPVGTAKIGRFLYDPDPAVVRAHLIDELADQVGGWKLDSAIAYISANVAVATPFARCYRVIDQRPFNLRALRRYLTANGMVPGAIKKRRFPIEPEKLRQLLAIDRSRMSSATEVVLIATRLGERRASRGADGGIVFICEPAIN